MQEEMGKNQDNNDAIHSEIVKVFMRVVTEEDFKKLLIENPDEALKEYDLTEPQLVMIKNLNPEDLNKLTPDNLQEFFAADAAVYTPDETALNDADAYTIEDFKSLEAGESGAPGSGGFIDLKQEDLEDPDPADGEKPEGL